MENSPLIRDLRAQLGAEGVLSAPSELAVYDCDAFTVQRQRPAAVVFPRTTQQVAAVVRACRQHGVPIVPRGAGTSLAGGCLPPDGSVVVMLSRMNRVLKIDLRNRMAAVEAGVPNLRLTQALAGTGYHFAPDPSSQGASTIGGNVATNAGGPHTLKYGVTVNHVLGLEAVLGDGSVVELGPVEDPAALDLIGVLVGSEGTLGIVTKVWVRLTPNPEDYRAMRAIFDAVDDATNAVSQIIAAGIIPAAMELMDAGILAAVEAAYHFGFPADAGAVLVIEADGPAAGIEEKQRQVVKLCRKFGARDVLTAASPAEREALWKCRKMAVGATGRLSPSYIIQDGVVPRTKLPHVLRRIAEIGRKHGVRIVNVAHAGDGNVHPILLFDERDRADVERALAAGRELLEECIACGGSVTAEHGIGVEKIDFMSRLFGPADLEAMRRVRQSFDPTGRLNPGKLIPEATNGWHALSAAKGVVARENTPFAALRDVPHAAKDAEAESSRVVDYPADDMTITVEAGMTVAELNQTLAAHRQWLPVDVPQPERATVGDILAMNVAGPRRYAYGTLRDYVLGLRAVDGTGMTFSAGGRVVKNAAGYNLCRLLVGSRGALAAITQVTLMVRPRPEAAAFAACDLPSLDAAERLLAALVHTRTLPAAIELFAGPAAQADPLFPPRSATAPARLYVGFDGAKAEVEWMVGRLAEEWRELGVAEPMTVTAAHATPFWQWLSGFSADVELHLLPSETVGVVARLLRWDAGCSIQAHAGNGVIQLRLPPLPPEKFAAAVRETLRPMAETAGGTLVVRRTPEGAELTGDDVRGKPGDGHTVAQCLKERFDPHGVLGP